MRPRRRRKAPSCSYIDILLNPFPAYPEGVHGSDHYALGQERRRNARESGASHLSAVRNLAIRGSCRGVVCRDRHVTAVARRATGNRSVRSPGAYAESAVVTRKRRDETRADPETSFCKAPPMLRRKTVAAAYHAQPREAKHAFESGSSPRSDRVVHERRQPSLAACWWERWPPLF
ncbi:hypothetical protein MRX96_016599 [Rhipicephalus microplus]